MPDALVVMNWLPLCEIDGVIVDVCVPVDDGVMLLDRLCDCVSDGVPEDEAVPPWVALCVALAD